NILPSDTVDCSYAGQTLIVSVRNLCNIQSCWGSISIEDKLKPQIECTCPIGNDDENCNINCLQANLLAQGIIPPELQPTVTDNCPNPVVTIQHIDLNDEGCGGGYVRVTWLATDASGNTATCIQQLNIVPLSLDNLVFPANYIGVCGIVPDPSITGWPQVNGINITDAGGICNIFAGYWDHELNDCGGGIKIQRTWTVLDWCTQQLVEGIQIIKLSDTEGPVLTCPADVTVGTDFWYCYSNFSVPKPLATDNCSEIESYELWASAGTVVAFGNNFVVNNLPVGTHILRWTVSDECGNSSTCSFKVTVQDDVVPVANCDQHTVVSLTNDGPSGITLVPASVFNDGSYDNCGPVTFRARRMDSCIDFDWTTEGACIDDIPGGVPPVNSRDRGTVHRPCVPFSCCDVGAGPVMVELEVTDAAGNKNYCMVEAIVQDKISPFIQCPPDIIVSCDFWFPAAEGTYIDAEGNQNGSLDEDPLSRIFGNMYDAFKYDESVRQPIVINDPGNDEYLQPHTWGLDGWADDNCEVHLQVRDRIIDDCTGGDLPGNAPQGAVRLIERRFIAEGAQEGVAPATCTQRIWVVDFDPFYITDNNCNNPNPNDGVIWPCDVLLTSCPDNLGDTGEPIIFDDACSLIGVTYEDTRFDFVDGACFKILRDWAIIDWCQYNPQTGYGIWHYTQVIKVHDKDGPAFVDCPAGPETLCVNDPGVTLPDNNQAFLGEENPLSSSCSVHLNLSKTVYETCSDVVQYDVKLYLFNGPDYIVLQSTTSAPVDSTNHAV
ncbi:MAG TPA: HYR domain-containing protein, partial [Saprospiraceae bacterium]|nr:HYR domain-containing protein [Saprospiraceae bacterium]